MIVQTRHDIELAKHFMHTLNDTTPTLEHIANLISLARTTLPSPERDVGPWSLGKGDDGRFYIESADFTHDVRFYLDGDFAHDQQRLGYLQYVTGSLNAALPPKAPIVKHPNGQPVQWQQGTINHVPPAITAEQVKERRAETGTSMMEAKQQLMDERMALMIDRFRGNPDHALLHEILDGLWVRS